MRYTDNGSVKTKSAEQLDHTALTFGKYKGMTPAKVAEVDAKYLVWMYETVTNRDTCSELLYRECKGNPAAATNSKDYYKPKEPKPQHKASSHFDDYDDDIPF